MRLRWLIIVAAVVVVGSARELVRRRRRSSGPSRTPRAKRTGFDSSSHIFLVAQREIRERLRSRAFLLTTAIILIVVGAAIIIPSHGNAPAKPIRIGVVGATTTSLRAVTDQVSAGLDATVAFANESSDAAAKRALIAGDVDVVVESTRLLVKSPLAPTDTSTNAVFVRSLATQLGIARAMADAHLTGSQIATLYAYKPFTIGSAKPAQPSNPIDATAIFGIIVIFIMLQQYGGWTLMGVMEEKSSRVIEVLLSSVRPIQLISGKVIGIGVVAVTQAASIVALAILVGLMSDSSILHGMEPWVIAASVVWLFLGYVFYSWLFAAAGSMVERIDQAQSIALPMSIPLIFGYVFALIQASMPTVSFAAKFFAYVPPTAPFLMPTLVGRHAVTWWEFLISAVIDIVGTVVLARGAAHVYSRAILRTGSRVRWSEVLHRTAPDAAAD